MGAKTGIAWTDATWNPIRGCSMAKGSETGGCLNCYAARMAARGLPGLNSSDGTPFARIMDSGPRWTGKVEIVEKALMLPLKWREPKRVFVNSMSDLFHEALTDQQIDRIFSIMAGSRKHTFQVLTKRPDRMLKYMLRFRPDGRGWMSPGGIDGDLSDCPLDASRFPLPNVWLGVSVENQATADARIPLLLQTPAAIRFVSYEPALGPVDFKRLAFDMAEVTHDLVTACIARGEVVTRESYENYPKAMPINGLSGCSPAGKLPGLDLIIVGGESGPVARPFEIAWARDVIAQCKSAGVSCFIKQLGPHAGLKDRKGADPSEWPEDLRVQDFPK